MSPRLAGDDPGYKFAMLSFGQPTEHTFSLPSVTTIIKDTLGVPAGAMSWYGYRIAMGGFADLLSDPDAVAEAIDADAEALEAQLKARGVSPNISLDAAGKRGNNAHKVLELLAEDKDDEAENLAGEEFVQNDTQYSAAVISWWRDKSLNAEAVVSERPVWSLRRGYVGTLDLGILRYGEPETIEIWDLKTHKPASGFTKPGGGPAYISDLTQIQAYAEAWNEMGLEPRAVPGGIVVARANGKYLTDLRRAPEGLFRQLVEVYRTKGDFA